MGKLLRPVVVLGLMVGVVAFWFHLDTFGIETSIRFYLVGGGASLLALGILYKLLGSWDLVPDWVPILGSIDDAFAWLVMALGLGVGAVGWYLF